MSNKIELIVKLIILYIFLLAVCILLYDLVVMPTNEAENVNAIIGLLGWSATIYAPIAAFFLLDSWKSQRKYELEYEYISNILINIKPIFEELTIIRGNSSIIQMTNNKYILYSDYTTRKNLYFLDPLIKLYPDIKIYSKIKNDDFLLNIYNQFDKRCFQVEIHYRYLISLYSDYYEKAISINPVHKNNYEIKETGYGYTQKLSLKNNIDQIERFFKDDREGTIDDTRFYFNFLTYLNETIEMHDSILDYCIKNLNIDNN